MLGIYQKSLLWKTLRLKSSDVKEVPKNVNDEFCLEDVYQMGDTVGITPFRCHEYRMLFLP